MAEMPPCCRKAAQKFMDLGFPAPASAAKAVREHPGHQTSNELTDNNQDESNRSFAPKGKPY